MDHGDGVHTGAVRPERDAELAAYVAFASELDDGEAMALAIAQSRGWQIATDDVELVGLRGATATMVWE
jgi:predicted nucleic acid-binding protein